MFGFGREKISVPAAAATFVSQMNRQVASNLPAIRDAINIPGSDSSPVGDEQLYAEVFPAVLAMGLQPVLNIWNAATFERAKQEVAFLIDRFGQDDPELSRHIKVRLDEYLTVWHDFKVETAVNLPHDDVTAGVVRYLGVGRTKVFGAVMIDPIVVESLSSVLVMLVGMYWRTIERQFKLL